MMQRFETKYDLMQQCYQDIEIKRTGKAIMQYLVYISNKKHCYPAVETIAKALNVSVRTIQRHMRSLEQRGYITRKSRYYNHEQLTNEYVFNFGVTSIRENSTKPYPANQGESICKIEIIDSIMQHDNLRITEKALLTYLTHIANKAGFVWKNIGEIAKVLNISVAYVKTIISRLCKRGLLILMHFGRNSVIYAKVKILVKSMGTAIDESLVSEKNFPEPNILCNQDITLYDSDTVKDKGIWEWIKHVITRAKFISQRWLKTIFMYC